jgi:Mrp family chromosome partitioning ATPase
MNIRAKQMIEKVGGNLVGIVLNNINLSQAAGYYYSDYYQDYYYKSEEAEPTTEGPAAKPEIKSKF